MHGIPVMIKGSGDLPAWVEIVLYESDGESSSYFLSVRVLPGKALMVEDTCEGATHMPSRDELNRW